MIIFIYLSNVSNILWFIIIVVLIICHVDYNKPGWMLLLIPIMIGLTVIAIS